MGKIADKKSVLEQIAFQQLGVVTLERRMSDALDFHDLGVENIKCALESAYEAGQANAIGAGDVVKKIGAIYNMACHGLMYQSEGEHANVKTALDEIHNGAEELHFALQS